MNLNNPKPQAVQYNIVRLLPEEPFIEIVHQDSELQSVMDKALTKMDLTEPLYIIRINEDLTWDAIFTRAGDVWVTYQKEISHD